MVFPLPESYRGPISEYWIGHGTAVNHHLEKMLAGEPTDYKGLVRSALHFFGVFAYMQRDKLIRQNPLDSRLRIVPVTLYARQSLAELYACDPDSVGLTEVSKTMTRYWKVIKETALAETIPSESLPDILDCHAFVESCQEGLVTKKSSPKRKQDRKLHERLGEAA